MLYKDFARMVKDSIHPVVTFKKAILDKESYAEPGMRGRIIDVSDDSHNVLILTVDFSEYDEFNKAFETSNYYDKNSNPTLNARQAGQYKPIDKIYVDSEYPHDDDFTIEDSDRLKLYDQFKSKATDANYVQWLESKVLEHTPNTDIPLPD